MAAPVLELETLLVRVVGNITDITAKMQTVFKDIDDLKKQQKIMLDVVADVGGAEKSLKKITSIAGETGEEAGKAWGRGFEKTVTAKATMFRQLFADIGKLGSMPPLTGIDAIAAGMASSIHQKFTMPAMSGAFTHPMAMAMSMSGNGNATLRQMMGGAGGSGGAGGFGRIFGFGGEDSSTFGVLGKYFLASRVLGAMGAPLHTGMAFEDEMIKSRNMFGRTGDTGFGKELTSSAFGGFADPKERVRTLGKMAAMGYDAAKAQMSLNSMESFAIANTTDLDQATTSLLQVQKGYGLTSKDNAENLKNLTRIQDVLTRATQLGGGSAITYANHLEGRLGAALRETGMSLEESTSALAVLHSQGAKGEPLMKFLGQLQSNVAHHPAAWKGLIGSVHDANGKLKPLTDIVRQLDSVLGKASNKQQEATLKMLGFADATIDTLKMLREGVDELQKFTKELEKAGGTSNKVADDIKSGLGKQLEQTMHYFKVIADDATSALAPGLKAVNSQVGEMVKFWMELPQGLRSAIVWIAALTVSLIALKLVLSTVAAAAAFLSGLGLTGAFLAGAAPLLIGGGILASIVTTQLASKPITDPTMGKIPSLFDQSGRFVGPGATFRKAFPGATSQGTDVRPGELAPGHFTSGLYQFKGVASADAAMQEASAIFQDIAKTMKSNSAKAGGDIGFLVGDTFQQLNLNRLGLDGPGGLSRGEVGNKKSSVHDETAHGLLREISHKLPGAATKK